MQDYKASVPRFLTGFDVPSTNNPAKQGIRKMKVKISCGSRTPAGAGTSATLL